MVKEASASYIVPRCMTLKPRRARYMSFRSSYCQHKIHWARFGWEIGFLILRSFIRVVFLNTFQLDLFTLARTLPYF